MFAPTVDHLFVRLSVSWPCEPPGRHEPSENGGFEWENHRKTIGKWRFLYNKWEIAREWKKVAFDG